MGQRVKAKYPGAYDDIPDGELGNRVKAKFPGAYDDFSDTARPALTAPGSDATEGVQVPGSEFQRRVIEGLPAAGGALGGYGGGLIGAPFGLAGPGKVIGGAVGGAGGEMGREALMGEPLSPGKIATQGVVQGGLEVLGAGITKGLSWGGKQIMRRAVAPSPALQREFPNLIDDTIKERALVTKGTLTNKITPLREDSAKKLMNMLNTARLGGKNIDTRKVAKYAMEFLKDPVPSSAKKAAVIKQLREFYKDRGLKIDPVVAKGIKNELQDDAKAVFKMTGRKKRTFESMMGRGMREEMENQIPGVGAREARTQSLIGVERAIDAATKRTPKGTYPVIGEIGNPAVQSWFALAMNDPNVLAAFRQSPRALTEAFQQLMLSAEADATGQ